MSLNISALQKGGVINVYADLPAEVRRQTAIESREQLEDSIKFWGTVSRETNKKVITEQLYMNGLPYVPRRTAYLSNPGDDVISWPFSGCYMIAYTVGNERRVGHISTGADRPDGLGGIDKHDISKKRLKTEFDSRAYMLEACFRPHNVNLTGIASGYNNIKFFGIITTKNECYSLVVNQNRSTLTILKIEKVASMTQFPD